MRPKSTLPTKDSRRRTSAGRSEQQYLMTDGRHHAKPQPARHDEPQRGPTYIHRSLLPQQYGHNPHLQMMAQPPVMRYDSANGPLAPISQQYLPGNGYTAPQRGQINLPHLAQMQPTHHPAVIGSQGFTYSQQWHPSDEISALNAGH